MNDLVEKIQEGINRVDKEDEFVKEIDLILYEEEEEIYR